MQFCKWLSLLEFSNSFHQKIAITAHEKRGKNIEIPCPSPNIHFYAHIFSFRRLVFFLKSVRYTWLHFIVINFISFEACLPCHNSIFLSGYIWWHFRTHLTVTKRLVNGIQNLYDIIWETFLRFKFFWSSDGFILLRGRKYQKDEKSPSYLKMQKVE